jgi:plastocyanin
MRRSRSLPLTLLALLLSGALLLGACGGGNDGDSDDDGDGGSSAATTTTAATDEAGTGADAVLTIKDFAFSGVSTVPKGTTVTVQNDGGTRHTVHPDEAGAFQAVEVDAGKTGEIVFGAAGTFPFHCNIHPSMKGTITVT